MTRYWVTVLALLLMVHQTGWSQTTDAKSNQPQPAYDIGGPLAGYKLPLWVGEHGEPAGYPGSIPGKYDRQGQAPEFQLYPDSVEHYRSYFHKYLPIRSFFDQQSLIKNWVAPNIPGAGKDQAETYAAPLYWVPRHDPVVNTGLKLKPVPVIRCKAGSPAMKLDLGELDAGVYAIRVVGAVETEHLKPVRQALFLRLVVNDQADGRSSAYRYRAGYNDEFYSVAELYFHAPVKRTYQAELSIDQGTQVELLIHNVTLDDALAGASRHAVKTRTALHVAPPKANASPSQFNKAQRLQRDAAIWHGFPRDNAQGGSGNFWNAAYHVALPEAVTLGAEGKAPAVIEEEHGKWVSGLDFAGPGDLSAPYLVNKKLNLTYTLADMAAGKPLPSPYPYADNGTGLVFRDAAQPDTHAQVWYPIAYETRERIKDYPEYINRGAKAWLSKADKDAAHDGAMALARWAWAYPTIDVANYLSHIVREPGPYGRDTRTRRRETTAMYLRHYMVYPEAVVSYDALFSYIDGNQELADSIGRFVPWVQTPKDVIKLIDTYFVQTMAKRIMRYHYHTGESDLAQLATVMGDNRITDPWMQWLFTRTFVYPLPPAGLPDVLVTSNDRDGANYIGSTFYAQGQGGMPIAAPLDPYLKNGGNKAFDLSDRKLYPKTLAHVYWRLRNVVAGGDFLRIGDVVGPDKSPGHTLGDLSFANWGWKWSGDPRFAFIIKHYLNRTDQNDTEWAAIEKAAATVARAPWLDQPSRIMPMWAGVLETGLQHDDIRFRRAAYLRLGLGVGHSHQDTLDLQVVAHGQPATIDGGQRPGYSKPYDGLTRSHNLVEVDGAGFYTYSWARTLADTPGARYLQAQATPPGGAKLYRRQLALIDADEGAGSAPVPISLQKPRSKNSTGITPANSYVLDIVRVAGGKQHTYCFHAMVDDDFQWNAIDPKPVTDMESPVGQYLKPFNSLPERLAAGKAPQLLQATWRQTRQGTGSEQYLLGANFQESLPRRFTRLHLLNVADAQAMIGTINGTQHKYTMTNLMVQKQDPQQLNSAFVAVVEPYVGDPFITHIRPLDIDANQTDASRAVAVEVKTKAGSTDVSMADDQPGAVRRIPQADMTASAEFAFVSTDTQGLRQATLVGGSLLQTPQINLTTATAERTGKVTRVDYLEKTLWIDQPWPQRSNAGVFEIGVPDHWTSYTSAQITPEAGGSKITVTQGADYYRAPVLSVNPQTGELTCAIPPSTGKTAGWDKHWVASDDSMTQFWRADHMGAGNFKLKGGSVEAASFGKANVLRLWEYGVGDQLRQSTYASLRRVSPAVYELTADVDLTIAMPGTALQSSTDGTNWKDLPVTANGKRVEASIKTTDLNPQGQLMLRVN